MNISPKLYDNVMRQLREKRLSQRDIAAGSGVPFSTLTKIAQGKTRSPSIHHIQAIQDFFNKNPQPTDRTKQQEAA